MADYVYTVTHDNKATRDSMTIEVGDTFAIYSSVQRIRYGVVSTSSSSPVRLMGNFPPEIPKTTAYWVNKESYLFEMINPVILRTIGTYTFGKGVSNTVSEYLTLNVIARQTPTIPVNVSGTWKEATPYVNVNGTWKDATPYVNVGGTWKETN